MRRRAFSPLLAISGTVCVLVALPALTGLGVWGGVAPLVLVALGALIVALTMRSSRQGGSRHRDAAPDEDETLAEARAEVERIDPLSAAASDGL